MYSEIYAGCLGSSKLNQNSRVPEKNCLVNVRRKKSSYIHHALNLPEENDPCDLLKRSAQTANPEFLMKIRNKLQLSEIEKRYQKAPEKLAPW